MPNRGGKQRRRIREAQRTFDRRSICVFRLFRRIRAAGPGPMFGRNARGAHTSPAASAALAQPGARRGRTLSNWAGAPAWSGCANTVPTMSRPEGRDGRFDPRQHPEVLAASGLTRQFVPGRDVVVRTRTLASDRYASSATCQRRTA